MRKNNAGYSFLEMLIMMVIMVILIMAALETYVKIRDKAYDISEKTLVAALGTALKAYYAKNLRWYGDNYAGENPFNLLGDNAPLHQYAGPSHPKDGRTWGDDLATGTCKDNGYTSGGPHRWHLYCPHYVATNGVKGNWWIYVVCDPSANPPIKPGTMILNRSLGH